jgi:hypothetical protein
MLRAAYSAPSTFIAELKRSAKINSFMEIEKQLILIPLLVMAFTFSGCSTTVSNYTPEPLAGSGASPIAIAEITEDIYHKSIATNAVVVFDVSWARKWKCGEYQNAELMKLEFDRLTGAPKALDAKADLIVEGPPRLLRTPLYIHYACLVTPGEYALSGISIKVARSIDDVGFLITKRSDLIVGGEAKGGTFKVAAGEIVYIGHFYLDCYYGPTLWRYYSQTKEHFQEQVGEYRAKYPFLEIERFRYRLFKTKYFGTDFDLPQ